MISLQEYLLLKLVDENKHYPIKKEKLYNQLRRKKLISIQYELDSDGQHTIETYIINPEKRYIYEEFERIVRSQERQEQSLKESKQAKVISVLAFVIPSLISIASLIFAIITAGKN